VGSREFQALVRQHRDAVFTFALYFLKHREDAEDVTQEVLVRFWNHHPKLDVELLPAWLRRVTRNLCCDVARRRRSLAGRAESTADDVAEREPPAGGPDPERIASASDFRRSLETALRELPEPHRSIVVLREIQGLRYDEIAAAVDRPLNTIKVYLHRGRKMLRDQLREVSAHA